MHNVFELPVAYEARWADNVASDIVRITGMDYARAKDFVAVARTIPSNRDLAVLLTHLCGDFGINNHLLIEEIHNYWHYVDDDKE